jgi:lactate dehydrogenase-like 2-hydroxyacid dehydrogenase
LARANDYLVVAARLQENVGLISRKVIEALGPTGYLVNVSRGRLVDEDALIEALREGALGGAALDVFAQEPTPAVRWKNVPNTFLTPHSSGKTHEAFLKMTEQLRTSLAGFFGTASIRRGVTGDGTSHFPKTVAPGAR